MNYREVEFDCGINIKSAMEYLYRISATDNYKYCGSFNGHTLNSDMTLDEAYTECLGMSYKDWIRYQEHQRKELIEKEEKHKKEIPELTDYYIEEGHKVLSEDKWKLWDECVPIRLNDLYEGMELGCCLDIIKRIEEESIAAGIETMKNQGHSGMSWGLMKSMIKTFCDCGDEFLEQLGD